MKIGIVGYGFVGKALANGLKDSVDLSIIDPKLGTSIKDLESFIKNRREVKARIWRPKEK